MAALPLRSTAWWIVFFLGIGLGYITVEIVAIHRLNLYLGNPTFALAVVLATLLAGSGVGSLAGGRWLAHWTPAATALLRAPRALNDPACWRHSSFSVTRPSRPRSPASVSSTGVRRIRPRSRSTAAETSLGVGTWGSSTGTGRVWPPSTGFGGFTSSA